jgi:formylglycine-generating enzyme required for sulfatase activity
MRKFNLKWIYIASVLTLILDGCFEVRNYYTPVRYNKNYFIDKTEVDIASWLSYYTWKLENEGIESADKVLPDSTAVVSEVWKFIRHKCSKKNNQGGYYTNQIIGNFCDECKELLDTNSYNKAINYCPILYYPITGLTYEQVNQFCEWRTRISENGLTYRLPSNEEWEAIALKGLNDNEKKNGFPDSLINEKCKKFNYRLSKHSNCFDTIVKIKEVGSTMQDLQGLYDIFGNVSEMTSIKGISKGGNYLLNASQCNKDTFQQYDKPERWLGFRCVAIKK